MGEVLMRLSPPLYQRLLKRTAVEKREPAEAIIEAIKHWLREEKQPSEAVRFQRALERTGLLVPPEEKRYAIREPVDEQTRERDRQRVRQMTAKLKTPLSEDIIRDRR
ncbi:MAG: hypothetical protein KAX24_11240 [Anaerolineae bacterium]|nr:hypothetical protein [Anaerolineae bacterium]